MSQEETDHWHREVLRRTQVVAKVLSQIRSPSSSETVVFRRYLPLSDEERKALNLPTAHEELCLGYAPLSTTLGAEFFLKYEDTEMEC